MLLDATYYCAFCGEPVETTVDASGGARQTYTEDCQVCCRPNVLHIEIEWLDGDPSLRIDAEPEYEA